MAPNQRRTPARSQQAGAAEIAAPGDEVAAVGELDRVALAERGQRAVDGFGALRIAWRLAQLISEERQQLAGDLAGLVLRQEVTDCRRPRGP